MSKPSYPKDMREHAKQRGRELVTVDVPGMCFQGSVDQKTVNKLLKWVTENVFKKQKGEDSP
jgi:hypothetical protein